jgi:hypothetical protein
MSPTLAISMLAISMLAISMLAVSCAALPPEGAFATRGGPAPFKGH